MKPESNQHTVAVLGLGLIGEIWARHLHEAGLLAAAWNRTPKPGTPCAVDTPRAAAEKARILIIAVADPQAVAQTLEPVLPVLNDSYVVIQSSTIGPDDSTHFRRLVTATGARYLEAPFTGSKPAAQERNLVYYLGGPGPVVTECEPVLKRLSAKRIHIGTGEQACAVKLAMNLQIATLTQALCEALHSVRRAGVSDEIFFECMRGNASWSPLAALKEPKLKARDYAPQFSVKHLLKDLRLLKKDTGAMPALDLMIKQLSACADLEQGDQDFSILYEQQPE